MMYTIKKIGVACMLLLFLQQQSFAQATQTVIDPDANFKLAKELYQKEQFSLAYPLFKQLAFQIGNNSKLPVSIQLESRYYAILCGLQLNEGTAEILAKEFITLEHHTPRIQMLGFQLGEYYFRKKEFTNALTEYEKVGVENLSNRQIADMKFHQAYCYFALQRFTYAKPLFNTIRQIPDDPNYIEANYYFGFISFYDREYNVALESFKLVQDQEAYQKVVPYYVTEIYYFTGQKDKAIAHGEEALEKGGQYYEVQLNQLIGHAWFEKQQYAKALPYLDYYVTNSQKVRREDLYELSYCYYKTNQLTKAINGFKQLGGKEDSLAQNSMYLLADAYLKTNQKANARNAFLFCASNSSNLVQKEISQFHYAKLSFELGYNNIALDELQQFISTYPQSSFIAESRELLVNTLANTNNFSEALKLYEALPTKNENVKKVYPRILYGRAVEMINDQQLSQADVLLDKILIAPYNAQQLPFTRFWKGEIAFRNNNYDLAIDYLEKYLSSSANNGEVNTTNARYNLGYCYMRKEAYRQALGYFEQVSRTISKTASNIEQDAYLRAADCYFMDKKFQQALAMYDAVLNAGLPTADYALFQKGIIAGGSGRNAEKISLLQSLEQRFPRSSYVAEANLEIANTYLADENYREAITPLNKIVKANNADVLKPAAYLKLGIAYFNLDYNKDALDNFKKLIAGYPNSPESDDAVDYIRRLFVADQKPAEFVTFMRNNGKEVSYTEEDSLTYASADLRYKAADNSGAIAGFKNYLSKFPDGRYALDANYGLAEIYLSRKDYTNALVYYDVLADKAPNKYAERSVLQAARINFFEQKDYVKAEAYYTQLKNLATQADNKLESMRGLLRCQYKLSKWTDAVTNAQDLLQQKGVATDDKMMANMVIAKSHQAAGDNDQAMSYYRIVYGLGKSEYGAEARYQVASILFEQNKLADAEKAAFDVVNKAGSYGFWITKAYLLLGDIYWKQKDYFNAEATFKSIVENAEDATLKTAAQAKLDKVIEEKNKNSKVGE